jgi:hypothetical protein
MSKPTILIVEDEAIIAADLASKLGKLSYEVSELRRGVRMPSKWRAA